MRITAEARAWLHECIAARGLNVDDIIDGIDNSRQSERTVRDIFNLKCRRKNKFDRQLIFAVAGVLGIEGDRFLKSLASRSRRSFQGTHELPLDDAIETNEWKTLLSESRPNRAIQETEAAMILEWPGQPANRVDFWLDTSLDYCSVMPESAKLLLRPQLDGYNYSFRLEQITAKVDAGHDYLVKLTLIPGYYVSEITFGHRKDDYRSMRAEGFANAVTFLKTRQRPVLPSSLAIHVAMISADKQLILRRKRSIGAEPKWEATYRSRPSSEVFLERAQARILAEPWFKYHWIWPCDLSRCMLYGVLVTREFLSPEFIAVYYAKESAKELCERVGPRWFGEYDSKAISMSPQALVPILPKLGPSSRIALVYALMSTACSKAQENRFLKELKHIHGSIPKSRKE